MLLFYYFWEVLKIKKVLVNKKKYWFTIILLFARFVREGRIFRLRPGCKANYNFYLHFFVSCKPARVVCVTQKREGSNWNHTCLSSYFGQFDCETGIRLHSMWHYKKVQISLSDFDAWWWRWVQPEVLSDNTECVKEHILGHWTFGFSQIVSTFAQTPQHRLHLGSVYVVLQPDCDT